MSQNKPVPNSQGLAAVFNISLGIVSWWTSKESERYNRLIQLRVFAFCLNILHAYITGPIVYQNEDVPLMAPGKTGEFAQQFHKKRSRNNNFFQDASSDCSD